MIPSACGTAKASPGLAANGSGATNRQFDAYAFDTCAISAANCVTVTLQGDNAVNLFASAYSPAFNPGNIVENYLADAGGSAASHSFSFDLPAGAQKFAIDIHDVPQGLAAPSGSAYTLSVTGACLGACNPPNRMPVAKARNVVVARRRRLRRGGGVHRRRLVGRGRRCAHDHAVARRPVHAGNDRRAADGRGSQRRHEPGDRDSDGRGPDTPRDLLPCADHGADVAGRVQRPGHLHNHRVGHAAPRSATVASTPASGSIFAAGVSTVTSTAKDEAGNSASCPIVVTVVDTEAPSISKLRVHVGKPRKVHDDDDDCGRFTGKNGKDRRGGKDHGNNRDDRVIDVTLNYDILDNCGASCVLSVLGPRRRDRNDQGPPDWTIVDAHHVRFIVDNDSKGPYERYTLKLTCTDAAGNQKVETATVSDPGPSMILDTLHQSGRYTALHPAFARAFAFLAGADWAALAPGSASVRHVIDGDRMYVSIDEKDGRGRDGARLEAHRRYIDIQVTIGGAEEIGWRALADCRQPAGPFDDAKDIVFFDDRPDTWLSVPPGIVRDLLPGGRPRPACGTRPLEEGDREDRDRLNAPSVRRASDGGAHHG